MNDEVDYFNIGVLLGALGGFVTGFAAAVLTSDEDLTTKTNNEQTTIIQQKDK